MLARSVLLRPELLPPDFGAPKCDYTELDDVAFVSAGWVDNGSFAIVDLPDRPNLPSHIRSGTTNCDRPHTDAGNGCVHDGR